jgi:hypothetical protein
MVACLAQYLQVMHSFFPFLIIPRQSFTCTERPHTKLADKCMALMWQIWLLAGPGKEAIREWLSTIRVIVSDWGTESGIHEAPDVVDAFFHYLETGKIAYDMIKPNTYLFPFAVWCPGWCHIWDNLTKDAVHKLPWWPAWLNIFKSCIRFFRFLSYRVSLSLALKGHIQNLLTNVWRGKIDQSE